MTDWSAAPLTDTADAIRAGRVRSRAVVEACLARYRALGGKLACFVALDEAAALAMADAADRALGGGATPGPLHGVPLAHKDMFHRSGRLPGRGSRIPAEAAAAGTATVLQRLDRAGALEIGRLLMVEFALGPHGYNPNHPQGRNPWNPDYIPGGSSSGSGIAVSARMVHGALGSDTGGSVRGPASVAGIVGLMPTNGRVSRFGAMPLSHSLDTVGPLTRTVRDAARLLDVIAGPDPLDANALPLPAPGFEAALDAPGPLPKVGVARGYFDVGLHPEVARELARACDDLRRSGIEVHDVGVPDDLMNEVAELQPVVLKPEAAAHHTDMMRSRQAEYGVEVAQRIQAGFFVPAADYVRALKARGAYLRAFAEAVFRHVDVLLTPTITVPVPTIAETSGKRGPAYNRMVAALTRNTKVVNYLGLPALSLPCGFTDSGMPTGMQLIGRPLREADILRVGHRFQQHTDWHQKVPGMLS
jgi:aspartyl-tRNA(Asn)/glutamyl-tRNA(Gln) amidotransferase subunit A